MPAQPPAYRRIADEITAQIATGVLAPGEPLPVGG
jgi:DNA-binding GntR family transcriptional regulator